MTKILILDDNQERLNQFRSRFSELSSKYEVDMVKTAVDCIDKLKRNQYKVVFVDHDLGGEEFVPTDRLETGTEVARFIEKNKDKFKETSFIIHSLNGYAATGMVDMIPNSFCLPFAWIKEVFGRINFS